MEKQDVQEKGESLRIQSSEAVRSLNSIRSFTRETSALNSLERTPLSGEVPTRIQIAARIQPLAAYLLTMSQMSTTLQTRNLGLSCPRRTSAVSRLSPGGSIFSRRLTSRRCKQAQSLQVRARAEDLSVPDRVFGAMPYLIPLLDGIRYGRYFFYQFPVAAQVLAPIKPLLNIYYGVPFASLVVFFGLYGGVVNNASFSRHVRFNAMQAILLSIVLIFPSLLEQLFRGAIGVGGPLQVNLYNTIWLFISACVAYGAGSSLLGTAARLPLVGSTADQRVF